MQYVIADIIKQAKVHIQKHTRCSQFRTLSLVGFPAKFRDWIFEEWVTLLAKRIDCKTKWHQIQLKFWYKEQFILSETYQAFEHVVSREMHPMAYSVDVRVNFIGLYLKREVVVLG